MEALGIPAEEPDQIPDPEAGALVTFSGIVRETEGDRAISHLHYVHYQGMAEREIFRLIGEARNRWALSRVGVWHRIGEVDRGRSSVIIVVLAGHRAEAFEACRFLIDELKKSVPIWKVAPE